MDGILFNERQRFNQWWLWLILLAINATLLVGLYNQIFNHRQFGNSPMDDSVLVIVSAFTFAFSALFFCFRLDTRIKDDGVYVRFFPFHLSFKHYSWESISRAAVRRYNPIIEYGGWGLRLGAFGKAYNVSGNYGLQLEFPDKGKLLIGTGKPEKLRKTLESMPLHNH
ncbi:hypothetical protein GZH53_18510 [Flavihumibacter sp. R14]|nr:hypothetical protein [Flavihumibacter soli]